MSEQPAFHAFKSVDGHHLLAVDGSRIYDIDARTHAALDAGDDSALAELSCGPAYVDEQPLEPPPLRSLSLNVAQGCNMSCSYCYADEGRFGGHARLMKAKLAEQAIDRLLQDIPPGEDAVVGYMGGEPFLNRDLIHHVTRYATDAATACGVRVRFSVTTNATLLTDADIDLLTTFPFTVAVSIDGDRRNNDRERRLHSGGSAYQHAIGGLQKLTATGRRPRHLSIRATVTPRMRELPSMLDAMLDLGVDEAGFSPVLVAPNPADQFTQDDFAWFLDEMIQCGERCRDSILAYRRYPFSNFETAMHEIARGSHRPYACGAAAGYASVSAEGRLFACHRTVDDPDFLIGNLNDGPDDQARRKFLAERHVLAQEPCSSCWARFLCGGGCHHEVVARGRPGCDYIRGWLDFCLRSYCELSSRRPEYFADPKSYFADAEGVLS